VKDEFSMVEFVLFSMGTLTVKKLCEDNTPNIERLSVVGVSLIKLVRPNLNLKGFVLFILNILTYNILFVIWKHRSCRLYWRELLWKMKIVR